ncbi:MAG TPA: S41 family peptidase [Balneolales bacterium]|nr:S41 family peptidase [Balneolales bacterium]
MIFISCTDIFIPKDNPDTPIYNFDTLWKEFDNHYSFFIYKNINWDSLYTIYRPKVTLQTSDPQLFGIMASLLSHLHDGHIILKSPFDIYAYEGWYLNYNQVFDLSLIQSDYLNGDYTITPSRKMLFGQLIPSVGYIYIISFNGVNWTSEMDNILQNLNLDRGLIIDIRNNGGGNDENMLKIAGRFTSEKKFFRIIRYRNGPDHSDFSKPYKGYVSPAGKQHYAGNIALLTNRGVFSAAESFVLAMKSNPYVTTIGDTTGGGSANPINRELPNGWTYKISTWIESTPEGEVFEGKGIPPDIALPKSIYNQSGSRDYILESALQYLNNLPN